MISALQDVEKGSFGADSSARVTRLVRVLCKTIMDELSQLWTVLKGDIALVCPRPEVRKCEDACLNHWNRILTGRSGITDPAAIEFRSEECMLAAQAEPETYYRNAILPRKMNRYKEHVQIRSFWNKFCILLPTVWAVIARSNGS